MDELWSIINSSFVFRNIVDFHFLRPWWLLFIFPTIFIYWLAKKEINSASKWQDKMSGNILIHLTIKGNTNDRISPKNLLLPFFLLMTFVLAGPSWQRQASPFLEDESVVVIAIDISSSMATNDIQPTRLLRAKQKINELMEHRGDSKMALVAFSGSAHVVMPITKDRKMIQYFIDALDTDVMPRKGKDQKLVIEKIEPLLGQLKVPATVLLMTDTTDVDAISAYESYFSKVSHQLIVWSINNPLNVSNKTANDKLQMLAKKSSGEFVPFSLTGDDLENIRRHIKSHLLTVGDSALPWQDGGYWLLLLLVAIHLMWFRKGWTIKW